VSHFRRCAAMTWRVSGCGKVEKDDHDCNRSPCGSTAQLGTHDDQHAWAEKGQDYVQMTKEEDVVKMSSHVRMKGAHG